MGYLPRLKEEYKSRIVAALKEEFGYKNVMQVPKLEKIVISRGVGAAVSDKKLVDYAVEELTKITGQKAVATISKKDVASFKLRGKRIFAMAPLHHHFELCGWHETKVVRVFDIITVIMGLIGILSVFIGGM